MYVQAKSDDLLVQEVDEEMVVYDQKTDRVHRLNPAAAAVWRHCDGKTTVRGIAAALADETGLPADEEIVHNALQQLDKAGLLADNASIIGGGKVISRRSLIARAGVGASLALLLPAVTSIIAPTPAYAQSITTTTTFTTTTTTIF